MNTNQPNQTTTPPAPSVQPTNPPPTTQIPPQPAPKKKKPWVLISIIVLLLSVTGVLGFKYYELKQQLNNQQPTPIPSPQLVVSSPTSTLELVPNLETYTDKNYSFEYPEGLFPIKYAPPLELGVHFYFSEKEAQEAYDCFAGKKGTIQSPCGINKVLDASYSQSETSNERSILNKYNNSSENSFISEYMDAKNRKWIIEGPVWGQGSSSNATAEYIKDELVHSFFMQVNGEMYGEYLNKELIIKTPQEDGGINWNAELLIQAHKELIETLLSSIEF